MCLLSGIWLTLLNNVGQDNSWRAHQKVIAILQPVTNHYKTTRKRESYYYMNHKSKELLWLVGPFAALNRIYRAPTPRFCQYIQTVSMSLTQCKRITNMSPIRATWFCFFFFCISCFSCLCNITSALRVKALFLHHDELLFLDAEHSTSFIQRVLVLQLMLGQSCLRDQKTGTTDGEFKKKKKRRGGQNVFCSLVLKSATRGRSPKYHHTVNSSGMRTHTHTRSSINAWAGVGTAG